MENLLQKKYRVKRKQIVRCEFDECTPAKK